MIGEQDPPEPMEHAARSSVGATAAQAGYEYQLDVSVLAALRLLLVTKSATRLVLEPANEEDLEADLAPDRPGRVQPSAGLGSGCKLIVQVKSNGGEPWSVEAFTALLEHGEERIKAKHNLDDPDARYLLVTDADAKGVARGLLVGDFEEQTDVDGFPASLRRWLGGHPEGRMAIWGGLTSRLIELEIGRILDDVLGVPRIRQPGCRMDLRNEARSRMRGSAPGVWTHDDLLGVIRANGGYLASMPELEAFVPPSNFSDMTTLLRERNAIVVQGPSGTGKTLAAMALCDLARRLDGSLDVVTVNPNDGPSAARKLMDTGPTLFYVEDPWGQYSLRGGSEAWTEQLPRMLRDARPGQRYVVTSRSDMLGQARAGQELARWSVELDADHYRNGELGRVYDFRMDLLPTGMQPRALAFRKGALDVLETPLELDLFFTNLADGPEPAEVDQAFFRRLLGLAHRDAVEGVVMRYLGSADVTGLSAVVWGLLAARGNFDRAQLSALQRRLRAIDPRLGDGLERLVDRLISTRHLRQPSRTVTFAHPSVRAGFEAFLKEDWPRNEAALISLISGLTALSGVYLEWGLETAARVLDSAIRLNTTIGGADGAFDASPTSREAIDGWLDEALLDPASDFGGLLQLAASVGTAGSLPSELARWFVNGVQRGGAMFLERWSPPDFSDAWYERIRADTRSAVIAERFVREQLARDRGRFGSEFAAKLDRIATGLTPAFLAVAREMVGTGFDQNVEVVANGAIPDIDGYEAVVGEALDDLSALRRAYDREGPARWRAIEDGECDKGYEEYHSSAHDDEGYASGIFVETYVSALRDAGRWRDLERHPRVMELAGHWAKVVRTSSAGATLEEVCSVLAVTRASGEEEAGWDAARQHWDDGLTSDLASRMLADVDDEGLRRSLAICALASARSALIDRFHAVAGSAAQLIHLVVDVHSAWSAIGTRQRADKIKPVLSVIPPDAAEIFRALALRNRSAKPVGSSALAMLEKAAATSPAAVLEAIVPVMIASGSRPAQAIRRWLVETEDKASAVAATKAAIAIRDDDLARLALAHERADARQAAFEHLERALPNPLPRELLDLASDPGSRVRRALVRALAERRHPDHLAVLVRMSRDKWSDAEPHYDEADSHPIARSAIGAITSYGAIPDTLGDGLIELAEATGDRDLRRAALNAAAALCGPEIRRRIWAFVEKGQAARLRVDALDALSAAPTVEGDIVGRITAEVLMRLPLPLMISATFLIGIHRAVDDAVGIFERVNHSKPHRALLLLGACALEHRDRVAALGILDLLDAGHPARRLLDLDGGPLPHTVLDDLGDVRVRRYVRACLQERIAKA